MLFVLVIQMSGGVYLAAASDMVGSTALMREDIMMAGYASLVGMSINFAVMFRIKFRFSTRTQLLVCGSIMVLANLLCARTDSSALLCAICFVGGWFRMQATFACNSSIQQWLAPDRNMGCFFCFVYLIVDGMIQLTGITAVYTAFNLKWEYMQWGIVGMLSIMMLMAALLLKPVRNPNYIPLRNIDWLGAVLWSLTMLSFTFICVYGDYYDWWESTEILCATAICAASLLTVIWHTATTTHPYISFDALTNRNVIRATVIYLVFFTLMASEHLFEHCYYSGILGMDEINVINLNWAALSGIIAGAVFCYLTFGKRRWRYKTMVTISFGGATLYLMWFYFFIDYSLPSGYLWLPIIVRSFSSMLVSIVLLTSMVQSGLSFAQFPQALTLNGFTGAVMGATFGPAVLGEWLNHTIAKNVSLLSSNITATTPGLMVGKLAGITAELHRHALLVSLKELYGWLAIASVLVVSVLFVSYNPIRQAAYMLGWRKIRRILRASD